MSRAALLNFLYRIIYFIEVGWLLIDTIGGYFLNKSEGNSAFNTIIRSIVLIIILFLFIADKNVKAKSLPFLLIIFFLILSFCQYILFRFDGLDIDIIFKLILLPIFLLLFKTQIEQGRLTQKNVYTILGFNILILAFNIVLSYFNIGFSNYGINKTGSFVGGTGFFYAGNEVGGVLTVLSCLGLYFYSKKGFGYTILFSILFFICSLGLLSKTALISVFLNVVFLILLSNFYRSFLIFIFIAILSLVLQQHIAQQISLFWTRISYFASQQGWETVLLGGQKRETALGVLSGLLFQKPLLILIGHGWTGYTENNFFDLLEAFGLWGYIFFVIPAIFFFLSIKNTNILKNRKMLLLVFNCILIFFVSILAGHIIQSAMNSLFLAMLLNFGYYKDLKTDKEVYA
jgi:O-antigen ligase